MIWRGIQRGLMDALLAIIFLILVVAVLLAAAGIIIGLVELLGGGMADAR